MLLIPRAFLDCAVANATSLPVADIANSVLGIRVGQVVLRRSQNILQDVSRHDKILGVIPKNIFGIVRAKYAPTVASASCSKDGKCGLRMSGITTKAQSKSATCLCSHHRGKIRIPCSKSTDNFFRCIISTHPESHIFNYHHGNETHCCARHRSRPTLPRSQNYHRSHPRLRRKYLQYRRAHRIHWSKC